MKGLPVVTADEMKRLESEAFASGESEEEYMLGAGSGIASVILKRLITPACGGTVYLLTGKGNNGGDAFVVGEILKKKGYYVTAYALYPMEECSELSKKMAAKFIKAGGKIVEVKAIPTFGEGIIVDGLVGTGFKGAAKGMLAEVITAANESDLPIFAVDIPSGLNATTGEVESVAIRAHATVSLGLPKIGFYINQGWDHVGKLVHVDFGLPHRFIDKCKAEAFLLDEETIGESLPKIERSRHKYESGYVIAVAGSLSMPGAAIMSCLAALKAGAGILRLFYPEDMINELTSAPYELIKEGWDLKDDTRISEESKRAKALLIGPGMGRTKEAQAAIKMVLARTILPTVLDADALWFLAQDNEMHLPKKTVLTPHHGEMQRILDADPTIENCSDYVLARNVTLVLKGAPTMIFHPEEEPIIVARGDPGMAKAGTGDVLTGIITGLLAQGLEPFQAAVLGVYLHAIAGEIAAESETSYGILATDLIYCLPEAIQSIQKEK